MHLLSMLTATVETTYDIGNGDEAAISAGMMVLIIVAVWLIQGFIMMRIAKNTGTENGWMAFVPILNVVLLCQCGGKPGWWIILFLIPIVNWIVGIIVWMGIAENCGRPSWWGVIISLIPCVGTIMLLILAFGAPPQRRAY